MSGSGNNQNSSFATGNTPGMGYTTAYGRPITGTSIMAQPGQYTPYSDPEWLSKGLNASNQPLQNANVTNFGRWGYGNGATNGYGMSQSPWPSANSITQPYGAPGIHGSGYGQAMAARMGQPGQPQPPQGQGTSGFGPVPPQAGPSGAPSGANQTALSGLWSQYANDPGMRSILLQQAQRYGGNAADVLGAGNINAYSAGGPNYWGQQGMSDQQYTQGVNTANQALAGAGFQGTPQRQMDPAEMAQRMYGPGYKRQ